MVRPPHKKIIEDAFYLFFLRLFRRAARGNGCQAQHAQRSGGDLGGKQ
jgi:hypothetical protein